MRAGCSLACLADALVHLPQGTQKILVLAPVQTIKHRPMMPIQDSHGLFHEPQALTGEGGQVLTAVMRVPCRLQKPLLLHQFYLPAYTGFCLAKSIGYLSLLYMRALFKHHQYLEPGKA